MLQPFTNTKHIHEILGQMRFEQNCVLQELATSYVGIHLEDSFGVEFPHVWATLKAVLLVKKEL